MKKAIFFFSAKGEILQYIESADGVLPDIHGADSIFVPGPSDFASCYVDTDLRTVVKKPVQPSPSHTFNYTTKQWEPDHVLAESQAKTARNRLLTGSDWTQLPDVPLATKEAWATYRQALRDITAQPGYPFNIIWPQAPQ